jgi:hypothetical protein
VRKNGLRTPSHSAVCSYEYLVFFFCDKYLVFFHSDPAALKKWHLVTTRDLVKAHADVA